MRAPALYLVFTMLRLSAPATLFLLIFLGFLSSPACAAGICRKTYALIAEKPQDPLWREENIARARLNAVVEHQNQIRAQRKIGLIHLMQKEPGTTEIEFAGKKVRVGEQSTELKIPNSDKKYWIDDSDKFSYEAVAGFHVVGNTLVRSLYNDIFGLNYVYIFNGDKLGSAVPYAIWSLMRSKEPVVRLYRAMGKEELDLWKNRQVAKLGSTDWGHSFTGDTQMPVVHFSTDPHHTTKGEASLEIRVPRSLLLYWAKKTGRLWSADISRGEDRQIDELILPNDLLQKLEAAGKLEIYLLK